MDLRLKKLSKEWGLTFFDSGEWQVVQERLHDSVRNRKPGKAYPYAPGYAHLFDALHATPRKEVRVGFVGQDPYPTAGHATGLAFDIPASVKPWPPTLINIMKEYQDDLGFPEPTTGSLVPWAKRGVLLWNAYPSVQIGKPGSHHWDEWGYLTRQVLGALRDQECIIVYFGRVAQTFALPSYQRQLFTSHPSPLGAKKGFLGSRIFTRVNNLLDTPIDWRLPLIL